MNVALLIPASSPGRISSTSTSKPWRSAHRRYIRSSISAQSCDSVPPAPAGRGATASLLSYSPPRSAVSSSPSISVLRAETVCSSSRSSSGRPSRQRSWSVAGASARRRSRDSNRSTSARSRARRVVSCWARAGSSHRDGSEAPCSNSATWARLASTSKELLGRGDALGQVLDPLGELAHAAYRTRLPNPCRTSLRIRGARHRDEAPAGPTVRRRAAGPAVRVKEGTMSARIETLRTRPRDPETAWLVAAVGLLALLAVLTLVGRIASDSNLPVCPPGGATTVGSTPGAAVKAIANDPYLRVRPPVDRSGLGDASTTSTVSEPGFGPRFNMGGAG